MKVAVAGCGPAGLAVGIKLARGGHKVTILERFSAPKATGSGLILQPTGLAVLRGLGLESAVAEKGKRLERILGITVPANKRVLDVNYDVLGRGVHGIAIHRAALFDVLYREALDSGVEVVMDTEVNSIGLRDGYARFLDVNESIAAEADLLIDASGANSILRHYAGQSGGTRPLKYGALWGSFDWPDTGFDDDTLEQRYVGAHTMVGVLPIGRHASLNHDQAAFFWSIKVKDYDNWIDAGLGAWKSQVANIWPQTTPILEQIHSSADLSLARYGHCTLRRPIGNRLAVIGDAAHSTSPQLGQGANMALLDAWVLAESLQRTAGLQNALEDYARLRRWHVRIFQLASLSLTPFYQSDSRLLAAVRDLAFDPVSKLPVARRIVAGLVSGMLPGVPSGLIKDRS